MRREEIRGLGNVIREANLTHKQIEAIQLAINELDFKYKVQEAVSESYSVGYADCLDMVKEFIDSKICKGDP